MSYQPTAADIPFVLPMRPPHTPQQSEYQNLTLAKWWLATGLIIYLLGTVLTSAPKPSGDTASEAATARKGEQLAKVYYLK